MRRAPDLDQLLENAVATALGLGTPHPEAPTRIRPSRRRALARRHHTIAVARHEHRKAA